MKDTLNEIEFLKNPQYFRLDFGQFAIAMALYLLGFFSTAILQGLSLFVLGSSDINMYLQPLFFVLPFLFVLGLYYILFLQSKHISYHFGFQFSPWYWYPIMILMFLGAMFLNEPIANAIPQSGLGGWLERLYQILEEMEKSLIQYPLTMGLMIAVLAPIFEELFFRGFLLKGFLNNRMNPIWAILLSSFIFAMAHLNPWQFVGAFILGTVLGLVYYKTQSILNTILLHAFNNGLGLVIFFSTHQMDYTEITQTDTWSSIAVGLFLLLGFGFLFLRLTKQHQWKFY